MGTIRRCDDAGCPAIVTIVNDAAQAYGGVITADRWREPHRPEAGLQVGIEAGVAFWGREDAGRPRAVIGLRDAGDVAVVLADPGATDRDLGGSDRRALAGD